jgi:hypothetical protein
MLDPTEEEGLMRLSTEISRDGPYLRVVLPDVLPPDWEALQRDLESEIEEGAPRMALIAARRAGSVHDDPRLIDLVRSLMSAGWDAVALYQDGTDPEAGAPLARMPA